MRRSNGKWLGAIALTLVVVGTVAAVVLLHLPIRPPAGVASPSGAAPALNVVQRVAGTIHAARGAAAQGQQPAVAIQFQGALQGWAIVGCGYGPPSTPGGPSPMNPCTIIGTKDGGASWHEELTTKAQLTELSFLSAADGFAWTGAGFCASGSCPTTIYSTTDGGRTWTPSYRGPSAFSGVTFASPTAAWAASSGVLMRSTDGAHTFTQALATNTCSFENVGFNGAVGIAVGSGPQGVCAYRTTNGGGSWSSWIAGLQSPQIASAFDAFIQASGLSAAVGGPVKAAGACIAGTAQSTGAESAWLTVVCNPINPDMLAVMHTSDGGLSWRLAWSTPGCLMACQSSGGSQDALFFLGGAAWRAAPSGVARSTDGGRNWTPGEQLCTSTQCLPALDFLNTDRGFAASGAGIFATRDGGTSWTRIWPSSGPGQLATVSLVTGMVGFAVPQIAPGTIIETRDGGRTWQRYATAPKGVNLTSIDFLSTRMGFAYGTRLGVNVLLFTSDNGRSYHSIPLPDGQFGTIQVAQLAFVTSKVGMAIDAFGNAWRTADGGRRWTPAGQFPLGHPQQVTWANTHQVYATAFLKAFAKSGSRTQLGGRFGLLESSDGGRSWTPVADWPWPPAKGQFNSSAVAAHGRNLWIFALGGLLHSTDGGRTWTEIRLQTSQILPSTLAFADNFHGWLLTSGQLYATADGGTTWEQVALSH